MNLNNALSPLIGRLPILAAWLARHHGRLLILTAAVLWSTSGLFTKTDLFDDWPLEHRGLLMAFWRALFAGLLLVPFMGRPSWDRRLVPMAACFAVMSVTYLNAVTMNTAANAIWLQSTAPLWVCLFTVAVLRRPVNRRDVAPLGFCALGLGVILAFEFAQPAVGGGFSHEFSQWGVANGLAAGACYAAVVMFLRSLRTANPVWLVAVNHLTTAAVLAPYVIYVGLWPSLTQLLVMAGFGLLQMGVPYLLFIRGLRSVASQEGSLIALLEPVLVPLWVFFVLGNDETNWWTFAGGGLILVGLMLRYLPVRKSDKNSETEANNP